MSDVKKKPRKISCLPCRNKKARCDEQHPYCSRCIRNNRQHLCIYPKPRTFGRPPKNAVFKNKDFVSTTTASMNNNKSTSSSSSSASSKNDTIECREFIFENQNIFVQQLKNNNKNLIVPQRFIRYSNQILDIERIFSLYVSRGITLRQRLTNYTTIPHFKLRSPNQVHTWLTTSIVNITIKRSCQFINVRSFFDPELAINAFMKPEHMKAFFFNSYISPNQSSITSSPLKSIPTDQAVKLIDYFFQRHPYHILLNKTKILQDYWNDSVEPLLLCVIYGVATFTCQQTTTGTGKLWDTDRNPFLNYAYVLMEEFFLKRDNPSATSPSTLGNYQACVTLGIFEILYGLPKHGMTLISLTYMMAADLGIFNHNKQITDGMFQDEFMFGKQTGPRLIDTLDPVDRELLINTYWAALRVTAYGCLERLYLRDTLLFHGQPFPAASIYSSASYQYDYANKNHTPSSAYLIESFHTEMVVTYFSSKLFACLPKTEYNVFGCQTYPPPSPTIGEHHDQQGNRVLLQLLQTAAFSSPLFDSVIDTKIQTVLNDFSEFITQEKHQWSFQQSYTIETTYYLYCIHFSFIKSSNNVDPIRYQQMSSDLDLSNPQVGARIANLQPTTSILIHLLQQFLMEIEEKNLYDTAEEFSHEGDATTALLPYGLMSTALETVVELTICHYKLGTNPGHIFDQIKSVYALIEHPVFWIPQQQPATKLIYKTLKSFLKQYHISLNKRETTETALFMQPYDLSLNNPEFMSFHNTIDNQALFLQDFNQLLNTFDGIY